MSGGGVVPPPITIVVDMDAVFPPPDRRHREPDAPHARPRRPAWAYDYTGNVPVARVEVNADASFHPTPVSTFVVASTTRVASIAVRGATKYIESGATSIEVNLPVVKSATTLYDERQRLVEEEMAVAMAVSIIIGKRKKRGREREHSGVESRYS